MMLISVRLYLLVKWWGRRELNPHWLDPKSSASAVGLRPLGLLSRRDQRTGRWSGVRPARSTEEEPVARDPDTIQLEIEQARDALASTLDQLGTKANPQRLVDTAKSNVSTTMGQPKDGYQLIGIGGL